VLARLIVCASLALAAAAPATALADDAEPPPIPVPAADSLMATAHSFAVARWGTDACGGQVAMAWDHMGAGINARSQWMSIDAADPGTFSDCSITYNLDVDWDWPKLCTVVEHELGHLSGHNHVDDPRDVMSPYYVYPAPECALPETQSPAPDRVRTASSAKKAPAKKRSVKRKGKKRAAAAVKRGASKKRKTRKKAATARDASLASLGARCSLAGASSLAAPSLGARPPTGRFGCVVLSG
jgi:Matrixin